MVPVAAAVQELKQLRLSRSEKVNLILVLIWLGWVFVSAALNGQPLPWTSTFVVAPLVLVVGVALGRVLGHVDAGFRDDGEQLPWVDIALWSTVIIFLPGIGLRFARGPLPLGYANANTAAVLQVLVLFVLALLNRERDRWARGALLAGAAVAAFAVVRHGSDAGMITAIPVVAVSVWMLLRPTRRSTWAVVVGVLAIGGAAGALPKLATTPVWPDVLLRAFDPVRKVMWQEAVELWSLHPITGAGPGSYVEVNPYNNDPDTTAAHSSVLQVGSELGLIGVLLAAALVTVGFLLLTQAAPQFAVVGAAGWTALWVHSMVDHLFDYPMVPLLAGVVLGWSSRSLRSPADTPLAAPNVGSEPSTPRS